MNMEKRSTSAFASVLKLKVWSSLVSSRTPRYSCARRAEAKRVSELQGAPACKQRDRSRTAAQTVAARCCSPHLHAKDAIEEEHHKQQPGHIDKRRDDGCNQVHHTLETKQEQKMEEQLGLVRIRMRVSAASSTEGIEQQSLKRVYAAIYLEHTEHREHPERRKRRRKACRREARLGTRCVHVKQEGSASGSE